MSNERDELPEGWEWQLLPRVAEIIMGQSPPGSTYNSGRTGLPFYQGKTDFGDLHPTPRVWCNEPKKTAKPGDILVSVRAPVGPTNIANEECAIGRGLCILRPLKGGPSRYLREYMQLIEEQVADMGKGSTFTSISRVDLETIEVPVPPLNEQHRIVAKIEQLFAESRTAREALDGVPALIKRFRQAVLAKAFRGELTERDPASRDEPASALLEQIRAERRAKSKKGVEPEPPDISGLPELPEGWCWTTLGGVFDVSPGGTPSRKIADYWNGDIPWVSSGEVAFCRIKDTREKITRAGSDNSSAKVYPIGTVLLAMIGEGKTRGQCAILDIEAANNQNVAAIRCGKTPIPSEYLFYWLMYRYDETRGGGQGGAQPALNGERVRQIPLPLAPLTEQRRIVAKIEALFAQADAIEAAVNVARQRAEKVDQAILARAFRGEL
jgi:type I restriction enzyme, S subunit